MPFAGEPFAQGGQPAPGGCAVEPDIHQPARPQPVEQDAPAGERIGHMMQHADAFDEIGRPVERRLESRQVQDIRLPEPDGVEPVLPGLHGGVAQARPAEIEGKQLGVRGVGERGLDRLLPRAAAGDRDAQRPLRPAAGR